MTDHDRFPPDPPREMRPRPLDRARASTGSLPLPRTAVGWLVSVNVAVYLAQTLGFMRELRLVGGEVLWMQFGSVARADITQHFEFWRLLTYMFVHDVPGPLHVLLNMLIVFVCGRSVEVRLGARAVVAIYLVGGMVGAVAQLVVHPAPPLVGASASAFALLAACGVLIPERKVMAIIGLILPLRLRVKYLVLGILAVTVATAVIDIVAGPNAQIPMVSGIGHMAHLGGACAGFAFCLLTGVGQPLTRADLQRARAAREAGCAPVAPGARSPAAAALAADPEPAVAMTDVDRILDKVAREGFLSLTPDEREILQRGLRRMSRT